VSAQICPDSLTANTNGNIFFLDGNNNRVRKIDTTGVITTVGGNGTQGLAGDGGPATNAEINAGFIAADPLGNLFLADTNEPGTGGRVRKINSIGTINTYAGNGTLGYNNNDKTAITASIDNPTGVAVDNTGNLYVGDWNNYRLRKADPSGQISTIAGTGSPCIGISPPCSGDGGPATNAPIGSPFGIAFDANGNLYFSDGYYGCSCVRKIDAGGILHTVAGGGSSNPGDGGPATSAALTPTALAFDGNGNLYITDSGGNSSFRIRKVDVAGTITTIAGGATAGFSGDGGPASNAQLSNPSGLAFDKAGNLYIGDGTRVRKVDTNGIISTFAGNGVFGFGGDGGPATSAELAQVDGVAVDQGGTVYIADGNNRIRKVDTHGTITTFAGTGAAGFSGDGGPAASAQFSHPGGIAFDNNGNLFIGDVFNYRVREIVMSPAPAVALSQASLTFGDQLATTASGAQTVTLNNTGTAALSVGNIGMAGTNAADFSETNNCGTSVALGGSCTISVTFTPTTSGSRSGMLSITDNAAGSPHTVGLAGTGTDFSLGAANGGSTSATISAGQTATYSLQVNPLSGFTGSVSVSCTGAPTLATCTSSASSVSVTGASSVQFTVTVSTAARSFVPPTQISRPWLRALHLPLLYVDVALVCILLAGHRAFGRGRSRMMRVWATASITLLCCATLVTASGCGSGGSGGGGGGGGTPAGAYTLTITGTDQGVNRTVSLTLAVN
jgi:hypothetical protein